MRSQEGQGLCAARPRNAGWKPRHGAVRLLRSTRVLQAGGAQLDFFDLVSDVISLRSFSSLWYWITLAVMWSSLSHWVLGIPYHIIQSARRGDAASQRDLAQLVDINCRRLLEFAKVSGVVMVGMSGFVVSTLIVLGWGYDIEFAQAVTLLLVPLVLVAALSVRTAQRLDASGYAEPEQALRMHRRVVQILAIMSIFATSFWGMFVNVTVSPLY